MHMIVGFAIDV